MAGREIRAGRAYIEAKLKDKGIRGQLSSLSRRFRSFGSTLMKIGGIGLGAVAAIATPLLKLAADAQEVDSKFKAVFGSLSATTEKWANDFAKQVGRSRTQMKQFLASTQDLLVPMGFGSEEAAGMSREISKLAVDLASFNNMSDADTLRDLQAALTGSGEVMKKYGVIVSQTAVNQRLLNQGIDPKAATEQQKAYARWQIILEGTTAAQGDAIRTSGSFTNQMKRAKAQVVDIATEVGKALLPILTPLVKRFGDATERAKDWINNNKGLVQALVAAAVAVGVLSAAVLALGTAFVTAGMAASAAGAMVTFFSGPVGAAVAAIGAVTAALAIGTAAFLKYTETGQKVVAVVKEAFGAEITKLINDFKTAWVGIQNAINAGDFALAFEIAMKAANLAVQRGVVAIAESLLGLREVMKDFVRELAKSSKFLTSFGAEALIKIDDWSDAVIGGTAAAKETIANMENEIEADQAGLASLVAEAANAAANAEAENAKKDEAAKAAAEAKAAEEGGADISSLSTKEKEEAATVAEAEAKSAREKADLANRTAARMELSDDEEGAVAARQYALKADADAKDLEEEARVARDEAKRSKIRDMVTADEKANADKPAKEKGGWLDLVGLGEAPKADLNAPWAKKLGEFAFQAGEGLGDLGGKAGEAIVKGAEEVGKRMDGGKGAEAAVLESSVAGSFSAAAATRLGMGGDKASERTATAVEKQLEETRGLREDIQQLEGPKFV